ncbi:MULTISPECIES: hypothetical protein [unclassified Ruegeria]|uniref:hypothetical protein n=1 Tax=unclassified Ruegeria TaxID=2625375 RepID=UPI001489AB14|nr:MULTISPECIES: hypothetical protein [unclassified Ruegeria]
MTHPILTPIRLNNGVWEGRLTSDAPPEVEILYCGKTLTDFELTQDGAEWVLQLTVPTETLSDGVHTILIQNAATHEKLGDITIIAGQPADDSLLAELSLLRAEVDLLKRVVRRLHVSGS